MSETIKNKFSYFANFCFEHGNTLRSHRQFGEMAREIEDNIAELEQKYRWIPVSDMSQLEDGKCYEILTKECPFFPSCEYYSFNEGWATDKEVTYYRQIILPEEEK